MSNVPRGVELLRFADLKDLDPDWIATHVPTILAVSGARWMSIDPYGHPDGDPVLAHWSSVVDVSGHHVDLDPGSAEHVRFFCEYAPFSAGAHIGLTGPGDVVCEAVDGLWVGLYLTDAQLDASGIDVTGDAWRTKPRRRPRWWRRRSA